MKNLAILGSTGSIGTNCLKIVEKFPERFQVKVLAAKQRVEMLSGQIQRFRPEIVVVYTEALAERLRSMLPADWPVEIRFGEKAYETAASHDSVDTVVAAMVGAAGLKPAMAAISAGKDIALANKETLVMAGEIVMRAVAENGIELLPVDSEHSAIFQCMQGSRREDVDRILLTGSGGPFRTMDRDRFDTVTVENALNHPNWDMGKKITIDSSTMMNKGLEVIEARWLFDMPLERIEVVVHPQSIVHSMVSFLDGSVIAQMGIPDMMGAIAYALSYPERLPLGQPVPAFAELGRLDFEKPDLDKFKCLALAVEACKTGGTLPAVLNAANEVAVDAFLNRRLEFTGIPELIRNVMDTHSMTVSPSLDEVLAADRWAREAAEEHIQDMNPLS